MSTRRVFTPRLSAIARFCTVARSIRPILVKRKMNTVASTQNTHSPMMNSRL